MRSDGGVHTRLAGSPAMAGLHSVTITMMAMAADSSGCRSEDWHAVIIALTVARGYILVPC